MRQIYTYSFLFFGCLFSSAQNDSLSAPQELREVVVTGQYNPQSVDKSVFQVKVITRADIDRQAGNNLSDLLNQQLNISVTPNAQSGKSGVQLFGLDAQYFKILVDNVPLVNDEDLGSDSDLTQINLDDVQQIEIVEGSMGVEFGANAVSGIINIITKKKSAHEWEITPFIQEETVGKEYNGIDQGRHIKSIRVAHNISAKWHANAMFTANDFDGYLNQFHGPNYVLNDGKRGFEWLPKQQFHAKGYLGFTPNSNHRFFYRFEFFDEQTKRFGPDVDVRYIPQTDTYDEVAQDDIFGTQRFVHLLNASGKFTNGIAYDLYASYQQQKRDLETFRYHIRSKERENQRDFEYESRKVYYSKGNLGNFLDGNIDFQLGYELSEINGFTSAQAIDNSEQPSQQSVSRSLGSYDVYGSSEIKSGKFTFRPGLRAMFSSKFDTQAAVSLSALYDIGKGYELRGILGSCPRLPDYEELYTFMVDVNHDVRGNPNLKPEQGISAFLHLNKIFTYQKDLAFDTKFSAWYIDVNDRIELVQVSNAPLRYLYSNIDLYRTIGFSGTTAMKYRNWLLNAGATFSGVSKVLDSEVAQNDDYLFGVQLNGNLAYRIPKWKTTFSLYAKYNGPQYQFVQQFDQAGNAVLYRGKISDYTLLDATIRKSFAGERLEITLGARNIANITTLNTTANAGAAHEGPATSMLLAYGRSYFFKILYKFNFG